MDEGSREIKMDPQPQWPMVMPPDRLSDVIGGFFDGAHVPHPVPNGWPMADIVRRADGWYWLRRKAG